MARPTNNDPVEIKRLLIWGVNGLIPMVNTVEEAELAYLNVVTNGIRGVAVSTCIKLWKIYRLF